MLYRFLPFTLMFVLSAASSQAAVVSSMLTGGSKASFGNTSDSDSSTMDTDSVQALVFGFSGYSASLLEWNSTGNALAASGLLVGEKVAGTRRASRHQVTNNLSFEFTVDSMTQIDFAGSWAFAGVFSGNDDGVSVSLNGGAGNLFSAASSGTTNDSFSFSGTLGPGTYTFSINAEIVERFVSADFAASGWSLSNFELTAIPEPNSLTLMLGGATFALFRSRRLVGIKCVVRVPSSG